MEFQYVARGIETKKRVVLWSSMLMLCSRLCLGTVTHTTEEAINDQIPSSALPLITRSSNITVFAAYMPFWGMDTYACRNEKCGNISMHGVFQPFLGGYRSDDQSIVDWHIKWAIEYGINVFVLDWGWFNQSDPSDLAIREGFLKSKYLNCINFTLCYFFDGLYWALDRNPQLNSTDFLLEDFAWLADHYFKHPSYYKIDQKHVLFLSPCLNWFNLTEVEQLLKPLRSWLNETHEIELHIIGDVIWPNDSAYNFEIYSRTFDAIFKLGEVGFVFNAHENISDVFQYDENIRLASDIYNEWFHNALDWDIGFVPSVTPGFNNTRVFRSGGGKYNRSLIIPRSNEGFETMLEVALEYIDPDNPMLYLFTWNDFQEGTSVEPTLEYGFTYLDSFASVLLGDPTGDLNEDGLIDIYDVVRTAIAFRSGPMDFNWNWFADLNGDNRINKVDVVLLANNFGKTA